jgi:hypothetical protein
VTRAGEDDARSILGSLQQLIDAGDLDGLLELFADDGVLIGTAGEGRDRAAVRRYLEGVVALAGRLRWEWDEVVPFHVTADALGWAAFGDVVIDEQRQPIRMTGFAVRGGDGWRMQQFHGSVATAG